MQTGCNRTNALPQWRRRLMCTRQWQFRKTRIQ
jgi:hypothetical protein